MKIIDININEQKRGLYKKSGGGNEWKDLGEKGRNQVLSEKEILELSGLIKKIEDHYGVPQDIEWAQENGKFYITQSRPITTLRNKKKSSIKKDGYLVEADADEGVVKILERTTKKLDLTKLYETQISLTEWFDEIDYKLSDEMRQEDNEKRERLSVLNKITNIPFDRPTQFVADDVTNRSVKFKKYLDEHGDELCAMRLIPTTLSLPKLRMRGHTIKDVVENWYPKQKIDPLKYRVDFISHSDNCIWSTIFVVNKEGIFGEIIKGTHARLTQGFYEKNKPIAFSFDFDVLKLDASATKKMQKHVETLIYFLLIKSKKKQTRLKKELRATFSHNYLQGYFETVTSKEFGTWFLDYNRLLGESYQNFKIITKDNKESGDRNVLIGQTSGGGKIKGKIKIIEDAETYFATGDILVCEMTKPEYIPLMKKSSAIITDLGGVLSHAAIVSRELGIPCVVGAEIATQVLNDGDLVEVDAENGVVRILEK